jgi:hypothetical protein
MNIWSWQIIGGGDTRNKNSLTVFHRRIIWQLLTKPLQVCVKRPVTSAEIKHHIWLISKCSVQQQNKVLELTWWLHKCCAVCVVNSSHCVDVSATAVGMLAVCVVNSSHCVDVSATAVGMLAVCVVNSSQCVVGSATAVWLLAVSGL